MCRPPSLPQDGTTARAASLKALREEQRPMPDSDWQTVASPVPLMDDDLRADLIAQATDGNPRARRPLARYVLDYDDGTHDQWLVSEFIPGDPADGEPDKLFGLCDLGRGKPELGYVTLNDLEDMSAADIAGVHRMVRRDTDWRPRQTLEEYADEAYKQGFITY